MLLNICKVSHPDRKRFSSKEEINREMEREIRRGRERESSEPFQVAIHTLGCQRRGRRREK